MPAGPDDPHVACWLCGVLSRVYDDDYRETVLTWDDVGVHLRATHGLTHISATVTDADRHTLALLVTHPSAHNRTPPPSLPLLLNINNVVTQIHGRGPDGTLALIQMLLLLGGERLHIVRLSMPQPELCVIVSGTPTWEDGPNPLATLLTGQKIFGKAIYGREGRDFTLTDAIVSRD